MNILVPLFHLIGLAAPHQTSGNTYDSPFLVRIFLPGMWQINMGIITDLSIERNGNDGLSIDGYPLELKVTLTIKDLYSDLMITPTTEPSLFICNTGLVDFIMIQCGLDVTNKNYTSKLNNAVISIGNSYKDIMSNVADSANQKVSEFVTNLVSGITGGILKEGGVPWIKRNGNTKINMVTYPRVSPAELRFSPEEITKVFEGV